MTRPRLSTFHPPPTTNTMAPNRTPGPLGVDDVPWCDEGTTCVARSLPPGPIVAQPDELAAPMCLSDPEGIVGPKCESNSETMKKVRRMRSWAESLGFTRAVQALDHYLEGSGEFVEIPTGKVESVRAQSEASHKQKFLEKIQGHFGAPEMLALQALVDQGNNTKPLDAWPATAEFQMDYLSGTAKAGVSDDNLAYYGSMIKSVVTIRCKHKQGERAYECRIIKWQAWVVDNYDWEGDKQFGGSLGAWILPSQQDMNQLAKAGCAKPYPRSSRSWEIPHATPWTVEYMNDEEVKLKAKFRREAIRDRQETLAKEAKEGALPIPGPAEGILGGSDQ